MSNGESAADVMSVFESSGAAAPVAAIDAYHNHALDPTNGEFLMPLVGVLDESIARGQSERLGDWSYL